MYTQSTLKFLPLLKFALLDRVAVLFTERTATEHLLALLEPAVSTEA